MQELFERMAQFGIQYNPLGNADQKFEIPEDVYRYMEYDYKEYSEKAKEKVYHCDFCNIDTAFRHHLRHSRTKSHIKKALQNVI